MSEQINRLTGHNYDGIQEYDNPLPGWWTWLFVASIIFAFFYWIYYQSGVPGRSIQDQYDRNADEVMQLGFAAIGELKPDRQNIVKYMNSTHKRKASPEWDVHAEVWKLVLDP